MKPRFFRDRREAGRVLAEKLAAYAHRPDVIVLALPRGGVPVAAEVARALGAPLDVFVVRKLGVPGADELAMGACASRGGRAVHRAVGRGRGPRGSVGVVGRGGVPGAGARVAGGARRRPGRSAWGSGGVGRGGGGGHRGEVGGMRGTGSQDVLASATKSSQRPTRLS